MSKQYSPKYSGQEIGSLIDKIGGVAEHETICAEYNAETDETAAHLYGTNDI